MAGSRQPGDAGGVDGDPATGGEAGGFALDLRRSFGAPIPDSSVGAVRKVARLDGRTRVIAGRVPGGPWWKLRHRMRFTRDHARVVREAGVSEVVLTRGMRRASFPLAWLSDRQG